MFYYWVNYAPITRGSSATGYAGLYAGLLAAGRSFAHRVAEGIQLDWEAMLSPTLDDFIGKISSWIFETVPAKVPAKYLDVQTWDRNSDCLKGDCSANCKVQVKYVLRTYRTQMKAMNYRNEVVELN